MSVSISQSTPGTADKILFIGNSLTYWNEGVDFHLEQLAGSGNQPLNIKTDSIVKPGASLKIMWKKTNSRALVKSGAYQVVVLQDDIPETDVATFHRYVRAFYEEIKEAGATPVLYMTWAYDRLGWITMEEIAQAHSKIESELDIEIAPAGLAWLHASEERPELDMYGPDREHPSIYGTYLAVNVIFATLFKKSPIGLPYRPDGGGVSNEEAAFLQKVAWRVVQGYHSGQ